MDYTEKLKDIILENNYFNTLAGQRFVEWNDIRYITAVIAFGGRSKKRESYRLASGYDGGTVYVTHLYVDKYGDVKVRMGPEDTDDFDVIIHPRGVPVECFDDDVLKEWVDLLTI